MIKANDLRINNWFNLNGKDFYIDLKILYAISSGMPDYDLQKINPVPLTEEWLLKFGFENHSEEKFFMRYYIIKNGQWYIDFYADGDCFLCVYYFNAGYIKVNVGNPLKYVHQLQNLFFTLTGEELTLNSQPVKK